MIEIRLNPTERELRQFAGIWLPALFGALGGLLLWNLGWVTVAVLLWAGAVAVAVIGLISPQKIRLVYLGWMWAVFPIGWVVSHLIMAGVFYLVVTPIGLLMRLSGYDPLGRKFDRAAKTYWVAHNPGGNVKRYFRQF